MQKIVTFLWFDNQAEEAAKFYTSLFDDSKITDVQRLTESGPGMEEPAMIVSFELQGQQFIALNGGPQFKFSEAISLYVNCKDQAEVDRLWDKLTEGGQEQPCGWLKDRYGLSWQIIPTRMMELMSDPDPEKSKRVTEAMLKMHKIEIAELEEAHQGS
jgi:predicted 3-demethylubiquinone-9 3-methyltransferase (glyoxalase superfamily)